MKKVLVKMDAMNSIIDSIKWFVVSAIAILGIVIAVMNYNNNQRNYAPQTTPSVETKK